MPEGHTIHRLARLLNASLAGKPVRASSPQGRFAEGAALLDGLTLLGADAWGKYLFCKFDSGDVLHVHLGLIGKFRARKAPIPDPVGAVRLRLQNAATAWDLSGPTRCDIISPMEQEQIWSRLGADPLRADADVAAAKDKFSHSKRAVGALVLDQSVVAGIGNVYRAELLFLCGIHPARPANSLTGLEFAQLWSETVRLLRLGERMGRIVTTDPAEIGATRSRMKAAERLYAYHRQICKRCGSAIEVLKIGGRPIWYCPSCQPVGVASEACS